MIILATHKLINKTGKPRKFQIGNNTIKLEPYGEIEINTKELKHQKQSVMKRALTLLPELYPEEVEVIDLQAPIKEKDNAQQVIFDKTEEE